MSLGTFLKSWGGDFGSYLSFFDNMYACVWVGIFFILNLNLAFLGE